VGSSGVTEADVPPDAMRKVLNVDAERPVGVALGASRDPYDTALLYGLMHAEAESPPA
jgi:hypothetical protein